jgi:hypothetical protein
MGLINDGTTRLLATHLLDYSLIGLLLHFTGVRLTLRYERATTLRYERATTLRYERATTLTRTNVRKNYGKGRRNYVNVRRNYGKGRRNPEFSNFMRFVEILCDFTKFSPFSLRFHYTLRPYEMTSLIGRKKIF